MKKEDLEKFKKILEKEKKKLICQLEEFAKRENKGWTSKFPKFDGETSSEIFADEVEEYSSRLSLKFNLEKRIKEIDLALKKIKEGKFGICEKCQKEIEIERLKLNPAARFCKSCKK